MLEKAGTEEALSLRGKSAVACAKMVYRSFNEFFHGKSFEEQKARGGRVQKLVWGSTGTKNPQYSDIIYVEEIIGPDTINTIPMSTLKAFLDHGQARLSLLENVEQAANTLDSLKNFNISLSAVTDQLLKDGVQAFIQAYDQLLESLTGRCHSSGSEGPSMKLRSSSRAAIFSSGKSSSLDSSSSLVSP